MAQNVTRLCRGVLRELKTVQSSKVNDDVTWPLVRELVRESSGKEQVKALQTFLYYIRSSARHRKLLETNARGERSVEESAHLVGLNLPKKTFHSD